MKDKPDMNYNEIKNWSEHTLFSGSHMVLIFSTVILLIWWYNAKKNPVSVAMQNELGNSNYFLFLTTHAQAFVAKIMIAVAIISMAISVYFYMQCGKMINMAILPKADTWPLYLSYIESLGHCQDAMNIGIFILPLTIIPLWWDAYVNKILLHRVYAAPFLHTPGCSPDGIYPCRNCGQRIRVAPNRTVRATCPKCGATHIYP